MENLITRYRNVTILVAILFAQILGLAVQVKRTSENQSTRLIRVWTVNAVTPLEKSIVWIQSGSANLWHEYFYLRGIRKENRDLKQEIERLRLEQVRLNEDAQQARRLQVLLSFKEQFISKTLAAQVIGSSGSEQSRSIYIDKGAREGLKPDMAVVTADGVVGKVLRVFGSKAYENSTSQVLLIDDQTSGVGAILEKSRLQGIVRGTPTGGVVLEKVMADEQVQPGEAVLTSGGDQIFPKGLPIGTVMAVSKGPESFLNIRVKSAADLGRLEEVLVITKQEEKEPVASAVGPVRTVDILAQRLPSVPDKPAEDANKPVANSAAGTASAPTLAPLKPESAGSTNPRPKENAVALADKSGPDSPPTIKPQVNGTAAESKPLVSAPAASKAIGAQGVVKPATAQKVPPPAVNVSNPVTKPAATQSKPQPAQHPANSAPPEDQPQ